MNIYKIVTALGSHGYLKWMPDKLYIKLYSKRMTGKWINLDNPQTLVEKMQWLKLNNHKPINTKMVDKYESKEYVKNIIGDEYIIPAIGIWDSVDDIDINKLPEKFVLKCTHDSGKVLICKNKNDFNFEEAKKVLRKRLKTDYYTTSREWPYKNVKHRILCEPLLENRDKSELVDYKFYCYGGELQYFMCSVGEASHNVKNHKFNLNLESIDYLFKKKSTLNLNDVKLPDNIDEMIAIARKLSNGFQHIRVDMYNVDGKIYVGELTFFSNSGFINIYNKQYEQHLADLIDISNLKK